jgi:hypothetical protein
MQNIFSPIKLAAALGLSLFVAASGASSAESTSPIQYPVYVRYVYKSSGAAGSSTYRGNSGYLQIRLTNSSGASPMTVYLCSSGATADECARGANYTRDQLLTFQTFFQTAILYGWPTPPVIDTVANPCEKVGSTYYCPTSFAFSSGT